jgi:transposase
MKKEEKRRQAYPSDLTDVQWVEIEPLYSGLREYAWSKRELTDAVLYFVKTGCQWRHLPHDFPPYSTVHSFYRRARLSGLWDKILQQLVVKTREDAGRKAEPSYAIIDSQSVKTVAASEERGIDGEKKRKDESGTSL